MIIYGPFDRLLLVLWWIAFLVFLSIPVSFGIILCLAFDGVRWIITGRDSFDGGLCDHLIALLDLLRPTGRRRDWHRIVSRPSVDEQDATR